MRTRIMYVEAKNPQHTGEACIGRVSFSKSMKRVYYRDQIFQRFTATILGNHYDLDTGDDYWISAPKKAGGDRLFHQRLPIEIDDDVRVEYWTTIRGRPDRVNDTDASR